MNSAIKTSPGYINFYFQVHQPRRLRRFSFFDIGRNTSFFDDALNEKITRQVAKNCYQPANAMLLKLIRRYPNIRATFSISGVALEQLIQYLPDVIKSFRALAETGAVEFLGETYFHSLAFLTGADEFITQVNKHRQIMEQTLKVKPVIFRNTELIYSDAIGRLVHNLGFKGIYTDGIERILRQGSANHLYEHKDRAGIKVFLRNYPLSDDIAFRFAEKQWKEWPLTAEKYLGWLEKSAHSQGLVNIGIDYETFGEHHSAETGIFTFMGGLLAGVAKSKKLVMITPSEAVCQLNSKDRISIPDAISWADKEKDLSAWLGNDLQRDAFNSMNRLRKRLIKSGDEFLINTWRYLQTSDHFYYMSTKEGDDGKIHNFFSPYPSPYEAFMNYMNVITDLELRLQQLHTGTQPDIKRASKRLRPAIMSRFNGIKPDVPGRTMPF